MISQRHIFSLTLIGSLCLSSIGNVFAQNYPTKIIRLVVPNAAGGTLDQIARVVSQNLTAAWGQQVIVDNRSGAGGNIGIGFVGKAPADVLAPAEN